MTTNPIQNRKPVLLVTTVGSFLVPFMSSSVNVALPAIGKEFAMDAILLGWVTTSFLLAIAVFLIPFGRIADIYGRKRIFLYGFVIYTFASLLAAISRSPFLLILSRSIQGAGASMTISTMLSILMSSFPAEERGKVLGINVAAVYAGLSFGPFLGGVLTHTFGWRSIFLINIPLGIPILFLTFWKIKGDWTEAKGEAFDFLGSILSSFTLVTVMYGFSRLPGVDGGLLILVGVLGFVGFVKWEMRAKCPIFEIGLFRKNKAFAFSNLAAWINYGATFAITFLLSLYLQLIKGLNPREAGLILVCQPVVQAVFSPFAGRLSDRMQPRIVASIGMGVTTVGLFLFIFLSEKTQAPLIVANLILLGFGFALFSSPNTNAVMSSVDKKLYGVASGILGTMRSTGMMFSMGITMLVFSVYIGRTQITPPYYPFFLKGVRVLFIVFAALSFVGIFASLAKGGAGGDD